MFLLKHQSHQSKEEVFWRTTLYILVITCTTENNSYKECNSQFEAQLWHVAAGIISDIWVYSLVGIFSGIAPSTLPLKKCYLSHVSVKKVYFTDTAPSFCIRSSSVLFLCRTIGVEASVRYMTWTGKSFLWLSSECPYFIKWCSGFYIRIAEKVMPCGWGLRCEILLFENT